MFLKKRHFFEEKPQNGDGVVLFTTNDWLVQKLDEWRTCLLVQREGCFFTWIMTSCYFMKPLRAFQKSVQPSSSYHPSPLS